MILGFHNYTDWGELKNSAAPHLLYGYAILGKYGKIMQLFCICRVLQYLKEEWYPEIIKILIVHMKRLYQNGVFHH